MRAWLNTRIARFRAKHHPRFSDSRRAGLFLRKIQIRLLRRT